MEYDRGRGGREGGKEAKYGKNNPCQI